MILYLFLEISHFLPKKKFSCIASSKGCTYLLSFYCFSMTQDYDTMCGSPDNPQHSPASSRKRLREWMIEQLDKNTCPGCEWVDRSQLIFKIPWKRIGTSGFDEHSVSFLCYILCHDQSNIDI